MFKLPPFVLTFGVFLLPCMTAAAQGTFTDEEVRQATRQVLNDAEFRYFDHLDESADRPPYRSAKKRIMMTGGEGGKEGRAERDEQDSRHEARSGPSQPRPKSPDRQEPVSDEESSATSLPLGAAGAVGNFFGAIFHALAYLVLLAVCGLIVYLIVLAVMSRDAGPSAIVASDLQLDAAADVEHSPGELPADAYLAKAREFAAQRQYRDAIAYLLLGGMSAIERADLIRHRRGLTLRDYLRALRGRDPHFEGFKSLIGLYEPVGFGRRVASYQTFHDALVGYELAVTNLA